MTLYASNTQIKAALGITDSDRDTLITMAGASASELIDLHCGRDFGSGTATRYFNGSDSHELRVDDLAGTAITVSTSTNADLVYDVTWSAADYLLTPLNARQNGITWPYTGLEAMKSLHFPTGASTVRIAGVFGWPAIPASITEAAVLQASRLYMRFQSPLGVAGSNDFGAMRVTRSVDPDVAVLLADFRDGSKAAGGIA